MDFITITEKASAQVKFLISELPSDIGLRLAVKGGGCSGLSYDLDFTIFRFFNTYGPNMCVNDGRVVSNFIVQALQGEHLTIYGDGTQTRSFQYVDDLIEGMIRMMNSNNFIGPVQKLL